MSISNQDKYEKELKKLDGNINKKTMDLENSMSEFHVKVRQLEEDIMRLDEDDNGTSGQGNTRS